ncbi:MAG: hypothetical protein GX556_13485, partial [Fibrobacter sp.]|nr:hypothetical protein [Fibrobacter sp.]
MKRMIELILLLCAALFIMCTDNKLVDGGSSSEVIATVDGRVLAKDGKAGEGIQVMLMPSAYNPLTGTGAKVYQSETDTDGFYSFDSIVKGSYNLFARNLFDLTRVLDLGITVKTERLMIKDNYLEMPASVTVALPESIDTSDGYVVLEGTPLYWPVRKITEMSDGSRAITLDSLPAGEIGALKYIELHGEDEYTIASSSITKENDTV